MKSKPRKNASCCAVNPSETFALAPDDQTLVFNKSALRTMPQRNGMFTYEGSCVCVACATERHTFRNGFERIFVVTTT